MYHWEHIKFFEIYQILFGVKCCRNSVFIAIVNVPYLFSIISFSEGLMLTVKDLVLSFTDGLPNLTVDFFNLIVDYSVTKFIIHCSFLKRIN